MFSCLSRVLEFPQSSSHLFLTFPHSTPPKQCSFSGRCSWNLRTNLWVLYLKKLENGNFWQINFDTNLERFSDQFSISVLLKVHKMPLGTKEQPSFLSPQSLPDTLPGIHKTDTNLHIRGSKLHGIQRPFVQYGLIKQVFYSFQDTFLF